MINILIPKEIKEGEGRVGLTPQAVRELIELRPEEIQVWIEKDAGKLSGYEDRAYQEMGAYIFYENFKPVFEEKIDLIIKVKEPLPEEYPFLLSGKKSVAGFFHFPANPGLKKFFEENNIRHLDYGEVVDEKGGRPILAAMSEIAGKYAALEGFYYLRRTYGGRGLMPQDAKVTVVGAGVAGIAAANTALNLGAKINIFDIKEKMVFAGGKFINTQISSVKNISEILPKTDLLISAPAVRGSRAPKIFSREMIRSMPIGSVLMDVSIDEDGSSKTSRLTTHIIPFYIEERVLHYCVPNIPGIVGRSASPILSQVALPYLKKFIQENFLK